MADVNQYVVTHKELLELLIKHNNVHEGLWALMIGMQIGTGNFGPTPELSQPGIMATVNQIGMQRLMPGTTQAPGSLVLDAAKVNPKKRNKS